MRPLRLRNILVATDLSEALLPPIRTAAELASLAEASLYVFHAASPAERPSEAALNAHLREAGVAARMVSGTRVHSGPAARAIADEAQRTDADVIVLGPHRRDRPEGLGTTAHELVRATDVPCLVLPRPLSLPLVGVLAPVDLSDAAPDVLNTALTWTSALRQRKHESGAATRLVVLNITSDDALETGDAARALDRKVAALRDAYANFTGVEVQQNVESGTSPAAVILDLADLGKFDLLVLGTRGNIAADSALGSVSSGVMRRTDRPVLLVPQRARTSTDAHG